MLDRQTGRQKEQTFELWKRNPIECIRELIGNPVFKDQLHYASERMYEDDKGTRPLFSDMWTGEWWERLQVCFWLS